MVVKAYSGAPWRRFGHLKLVFWGENVPKPPKMTHLDTTWHLKIVFSIKYEHRIPMGGPPAAGAHFCEDTRATEAADTRGPLSESPRYVPFGLPTALKTLET